MQPEEVKTATQAHTTAGKRGLAHGRVSIHPTAAKRRDARTGFLRGLDSPRNGASEEKTTGSIRCDVGCRS